ncbi:arylacetamide deacetylase-like 3 [Sceloporus undulatus]|uniref:arylacetamide deacetylase-like 3 n=1 Tax=Sceloporus undulatus TaxID=8520 RepID=UPI001C4C3A56|nr:arylacetamide deacetylase-like 3 [Sceloporus undulatus]
MDACPHFKDRSLSISHLHIEGVPVRLYQPKALQPKQRGILFIHGGAGTTGSLAAYERVCRHISKKSDSVMLSIGYSLVPYQPFPVQFQQCLDVVIHFMKHAEEYGVDSGRVIICGDSFGGLLAASVCQMLVGRNDVPKIQAQMLIYPFLQSVKHSLPSYMQNAKTPLLNKRQMVKLALKYLQKNVSLQESILQGAHVSKAVKAKYSKWLSHDNIPDEFKARECKALAPPSHPFGDMQELIDQLCEPMLSPLLAEDAIFQRLPDTFILTAQYDVLRDDGVLYKKRLEDNGVPVSWCHVEDAFHGFVNLINLGFLSFSCGKRGVSSIVNYIQRF